MKKLAFIALILIVCLLVSFFSCAEAAPKAAQLPTPIPILTSEVEVNTHGFYMPPEMEVKVTNGSYMGMYWLCEFSVPITNKGEEAATHILTWRDSVEMEGHTQEITLAPGETYIWSHSQYIDFRRIPEYSLWLSGDWEGNNNSQGIARSSSPITTSSSPITSFSSPINWWLISAIIASCIILAVITSIVLRRRKARKLQMAQKKKKKSRGKMV